MFLHGKMHEGPVARHVCLSRSSRVCSRRKVQSQHIMKGRSFGTSARNYPEIRWTFRKYRKVSVVLKDCEF